MASGEWNGPGLASTGCPGPYAFTPHSPFALALAFPYVVPPNTHAMYTMNTNPTAMAAAR